MQPLKKNHPKTHVNPALAVPTANVVKLTNKQSVLVCPTMSVVPRVVDQNVWSAPNVPKIKPALIRNVLIHVRERVALTPTVRS